MLRNLWNKVAQFFSDIFRPQYVIAPHKIRRTYAWKYTKTTKPWSPDADEE